MGGVLRDPAILDFTLSPREREVVAEFARRSRDHFGPRLVRVLLYGSRARGDVDEDSDIDVLVVLRGEPTNDDIDWCFAASGDLVAAGDEYTDLMPRPIAASLLDDLVRRERRFGLEVVEQGIEL